jgi:hypothetical protein
LNLSFYFGTQSNLHRYTGIICQHILVCGKMFVSTSLMCGEFDLGLDL